MFHTTFIFTTLKRGTLEPTSQILKNKLSLG